MARCLVVEKAKSLLTIPEFVELADLLLSSCDRSPLRLVCKGIPPVVRLLCSSKVHSLQVFDMHASVFHIDRLIELLPLIGYVLFFRELPSLSLAPSIWRTNPPTHAAHLLPLLMNTVDIQQEMCCKKQQQLSHVKGTFKLSVATVNVEILPENVVGVIVRVRALLANSSPSSPSLVS